MKADASRIPESLKRIPDFRENHSNTYTTNHIILHNAPVIL